MLAAENKLIAALSSNGGHGVVGPPTLEGWNSEEKHKHEPQRHVCIKHGASISLTIHLCARTIAHARRHVRTHARTRTRTHTPICICWTARTS